MLIGMDELTRLRERAKACPVPMKDLAAKAGVKERWLRLFVAGDIPEPGYSKVKRLGRALSSAERTAKAAA